MQDLLRAVERGGYTKETARALGEQLVNKQLEGVVIQYNTTTIQYSDAAARQGCRTLIFAICFLFLLCKFAFEINFEAQTF